MLNRAFASADVVVDVEAETVWTAMASIAASMRPSSSSDGRTAARPTKTPATPHIVAYTSAVLSTLPESVFGSSSTKLDLSRHKVSSRAARGSAARTPDSVSSLSGARARRTP